MSLLLLKELIIIFLFIIVESTKGPRLIGGEAIILHFTLLKPYILHQDNMSVCFIPPYTPLLYSKPGVYRDLHYFLIFAQKHILWVLVRIVSLRRLTCTHNICFWQKYENSKKKKATENCYFYSREKTLYIAWGVFS